MNQQDMGRAALEASKTCIILTNKNAVDPVTIDHKNILQGLAMKKYVQDTSGTQLRLCMQLIKSDSKQHYMSSMGHNGAANDDQLIIVEEVKMALLAKSCFAPGIISFISNLIMSSGEDEDADDEEEEQWVSEYVQGMDHEIYRCRLSTKVEGRYFSELVRMIYKKLRAIVFAIEVNCNQRTIIRLNPADFLVNNIEDNQIHVYCICPSPQTAELIETLEMTRDQYNKYHAQKNKEEEEEEEEASAGGDNTPKSQRIPEQIHNDDIQVEEERMGLTVKVTGIKLRNLRGESD